MGEVVEVCVEQITSERAAIEHQNSASKSKEHYSLQLIERAMRVSDIHSASDRMEECELESGPSHQREGNPQVDSLPITESRKGNFFSSVFLLLSSGIGIQALLLPVAFVALGWFWGILCLSLAFLWQLYTIWLLVHLHESVPGTRYSRFLHLSIASFGEKLGKMIAIFPVMYLSGGTCVMLIITGGGTMKLFYQVICGDEPTCIAKSPTGAEWYLIFTCLAILVAQFCPNLNSVAGVSLLGAVTAAGYCTLLWTLSISKWRPAGVSYDPSKAVRSEMDRVRGVLNALGIIALAFRGHNVVLEIQGTIPSNDKQPSYKLMWRGVTTSYLLIATCLFSLAIAGYWAYGNTIIANGGGLLVAFSTVHGDKVPKFLMGAIYLLVIINCITTFQIYAMVVFDNLEMRYTSSKNRRCPRWVCSGFRVLFGGFTYFVSVALPFLGSLAAFIGGIALPLTLSYPCFMWIAIKKPSHSSVMWRVNTGLGWLGVALSVVLVGAALWDLVTKGIDANFFNPRIMGETTDRGVFDFTGKKKDEKCEDAEVDMIEFEPENQEKKEEENKHSLMDELQRSRSHSSSSSDEEIGEGGERKKKKKKKGLKEKINDKISGDHQTEEEQQHHHMDQKDTPITPIAKCDEMGKTEATPPEEKKGFLEKIKEKLPGQHKKTEEGSPTSKAECDESRCSIGGETKEKKGILEKIKEKLPGGHKNGTREDEEVKEKEN